MRVIKRRGHRLEPAASEPPASTTRRTAASVLPRARPRSNCLLPSASLSSLRLPLLRVRRLLPKPCLLRRRVPHGGSSPAEGSCRPPPPAEPRRTRRSPGLRADPARPRGWSDFPESCARRLDARGARDVDVEAESISRIWRAKPPRRRRVRRVRHPPRTIGSPNCRAVPHSSR